MGLVAESVWFHLFDASGKRVQMTEVQAGSTLAYFDCRTLYNGVYFVQMSVGGQMMMVGKVVVEK